MPRVIALVTACALLMGACNTVSGVGRDMQSAGKAVTGAARDAKH
jgi:predicted small secreted protein